MELKKDRAWVSVNWESFAEKLKTNVVNLASFGTFLTFVFGSALMAKVQPNVASEILALLVGIGIGGLFTAIGAILTPAPDKPEPHGPCVSEEAHKHVLNTVKEMFMAGMNKFGG